MVEAACDAFAVSETWPTNAIAGRFAQNMRAALEAAERAAWQPIETAPKDGSRILLRAMSQHVGWWEDENDWWATGLDSYVRNPTHWRPLPAPPGADHG